MKERGDVEDSSDETGQESQYEGSWLRRRRVAARRAQREASAPAGPEPIAGASLSSLSPLPVPQPVAIWTDSHCHLQDEPDPVATIAQAREARVGRVVCVGTDAASSRRAVLLANELSENQASGPPRYRGLGNRRAAPARRQGRAGRGDGVPRRAVRGGGLAPVPCRGHR